MDGSSIIVSIGKEYRATIDKVEYQIRNLRSFYTHNKEEFNNLLDSITEQAKAIVEVTNTILESVTADSIPELVMDRMEGKHEAPDSPEMIRGLVTKRLGELWDIFDRKYVTEQFTIILDVAGKKLLVAQGQSISWDHLTVFNTKQVRVQDVECCVYFLAQYDTIRAKVKQVTDALEAFGAKLK